VADGFARDGFALDQGGCAGCGLYLDVKTIWFDTEASITSAALKSDVNLDPWVISVGVGRKF